MLGRARFITTGGIDAFGQLLPKERTDACGRYGFIIAIGDTHAFDRSGCMITTEGADTWRCCRQVGGWVSLQGRPSVAVSATRNYTSKQDVSLVIEVHLNTAKQTNVLRIERGLNSGFVVRRFKDRFLP
jgi:hypothetical protein